MAKKVKDGKGIIPEGTTKIDKTFMNCMDLESIEIPSSVTEIMPWAFEGCTNLEKIEVSPENKVYDSREDCNAVIESESNHLVCGCKNTKIPNSVTRIQDSAFAYCEGLTSIEIPNSVKMIFAFAFKGCTGLTSIKIPDSLTEIDQDVFNGCTGLKSLKIPTSVTNLLSEEQQVVFYEMYDNQKPQSIRSEFQKRGLYIEDVAIECTRTDKNGVSYKTRDYETHSDGNTLITELFDFLLV